MSDNSLLGIEYHGDLNICQICGCIPHPNGLHDCIECERQVCGDCWCEGGIGCINCVEG